jgi:methyl-accepting chemotaxis protein
MKTMTIGKKISLACMALVALTIILGTVSIFEIGRLNTAAQSIVMSSMPTDASVARLDGLLKEQRAIALKHMLVESAELKSQADAEMADSISKFQAELTVYEKLIASPRGRELFARVALPLEQLNRAWARIAPLSRESKQKESVALWMTEGRPAAAAVTKAFDDLLDFNKTQTAELVAATGNAGVAASFWSMVILVVSVVSGGLLAFFITRGINKALTQAVTELKESAEQVSSASSQVSGSSQLLAQGASEQAASLEETSASSEEMASMTRKNAENSQQAAEFMNAVSQRVIEANRTLADMMTSMQEIGASSGKISKIIKVIDEIAFQTNILALNAAVEAARAGEAGMGFAVVADEVRNLAQRSAQAAKDTATLIEDSILKSGEGSKKLGEVAGSIQAITEGAGKVKTLVDEVEASSNEQAQGIEQISKAVAQMDSVTQRTAANAEESAAASEELSAQSQALLAVLERLQALVGGGAPYSTLSRRPIAAKRPPSARPVVHSNHSLRPAKSGTRNLVLTGAVARNASEFPLDDSKFKEF